MKETITIEKLFGGFAPVNTATTPTEGGEDQFTRSIVIDVLRANFIGHFAPGELFSAITDSNNRVSQVPLNGIVSSSGRVFCVLRNGVLVQFELGNDIVDGTYVVGTTVVTDDNSDVLAFRDGNGTEWVAWTYQYGAAGATGADIARVKIDGTNQDDDFFSTLSGSARLTKGVPLRLWIGPDRIMYSTNGQYIASHDPATASGNAQALNLGAGWVSVAGISWDKFSAIIAYKETTNLPNFAASESKLFLWDGFSPEPNFIYDLGDYFVTGVINNDGILFIFTQGRDGKMRMKTFAGEGILTVVEYPASLIGNAPKQGGIDIYRGVPHWCQDSGNFNISAAIPLGKGRYGLHEVMVPNVTSGSPVDVGMLKNLGSNNLYAGANTAGSTYRILKIDHASYYTASNLRTRLYKLPARSTIHKIRVYLSQFGTGASFLLSLFQDYDAVSVGGAADLLNKTINNSAGRNEGYISIPVYIPNIEAFYMNIGFNHVLASDTAAIIRRIEVEYETTTGI